MNDRDTPNIVQRKVNRKFSKRAVLTLALLGTLVVLVIAFAASTQPKPRGIAGTSDEEKLTMASARQSLDLERRIQEAQLPFKPSSSAQNGNVPGQKESAANLETSSDRSGIIKPNDNLSLPEPARPHDGNNEELSGLEREKLNQERALRQQWMELQREAFLSSPATRGNWGGQKNVSTKDETEESGPSRDRDNPYLEVYKKYLEHENQKTGNISSPSQSDKEQFFNARNSGKGVLSTAARAPISPYLIPSGSMIPCNLITGVNSDLPGYVVAQVAENVCDWKNPDIILIPQGTRVFGVYDSKIAFAQRRVQISWSRLIYPSGTTLDLQGMPGADKRGFSGLSDKYYPRYGRLLTAAIMTAAFSSVGLLFDDNSGQTVVSTGSSTVVIPDDNNNARNEFAREIADSIGNAGEQLFNKYLNTAPTVQIRPAKRFNIIVNADIPFFSTYGRVR